MSYSYQETNRIGDHIWYVSDVRKFQSHYPDWTWKYDLEQTLQQMHDAMLKRNQ
jgi:CDP-paratose 2-epimerase